MLGTVLDPGVKMVSKTITAPMYRMQYSLAKERKINEVITQMNTYFRTEIKAIIKTHVAL